MPEPVKRSEYVVLVPQKALSAAKTRLRSVFSQDARREFTLKLLRRTLALCAALPDKAGFFLCGDNDVADLAAEAGADLLGGGAGGMRRDIALAAEDWRIFGNAAMLIVSADLPLLTLADLAAVVDAWRACAHVVLGPDLRGRGTNVMLVNDPEHFAFCFGEAVGQGSFASHRSTAQGYGLPVAVIERPGIALDIDLPVDIAAFVRDAPDDPLARFAVARFQESFRFE
jgi:2-phospho-L-lactate guanylyltransferase